MSVLRLIPLKGEAIIVDADEALVGREASCNVIASHPSVSRRHALIKRKQDVFFVVDQGSANGTFVDSKRVVDATLRDGTVLRFGSATFKVEVREDAPVESVAVDDLEVSATMVGQPGQHNFAATVLEGAVLPDDGETPHYGTPVLMAEEPAPTIQSPVLRAPAPAPVERREPSRAPASPPSAQAPAHAHAPAVVPAPNRGPAFWLMIGAGGLALLFVGAALALFAVFIARRLGWL
jgi:pSer/pThr/pTyr-binding forkhead associated (FHA) protein